MLNCSFKVRRLLWGKWQRLTRWEFWPMWAVYPPIIGWLLWLALKNREWTLWANCNPALPGSGLALESKGGNLDSFKGPDGKIQRARYLRLAAHLPDGYERIIAEGFSFPLVLKPNLGQRGVGVEIIHDESSAREWLKSPAEKEGAILSLCGKHSQKVIGDGQSSLEELILADERAITMAGYYLKKYAKQLPRVLEKNEEFVIAPIGTHSRGAIFTDERHLVTPELVAAFDELGARFPGFNFGRYDVKVPSVEDLIAGRNIKILELNAVTGEPAHVYQPGYSWINGMRDFFSHFERATEIGKAWRDQGVEPPTMDELWKIVMAHREKEFYELDS